MKTVINDQVLPEETLHTVFVKAEAIVNNRLLTAVSDDVNNYVALTPNHYLIKRASNNSPPGQFEEGKINSRKVVENGPGACRHDMAMMAQGVFA